MAYHHKIYDVQTLAMLCCVFWDRQYLLSIQPQNLRKSASKNSLDYAPVNIEAKFGSSTDSGVNMLPTLVQGSMPPGTPDVTYSTIPAFLSKAMVKVRRSNSFTDFSFEDYKFADDTDPKVKAEEIEKKQHENNCRMLDPSKYPQYDHYMRVYADILYRWGLRNQSTHILKHVTIPPEPHAGLEFGVQCHYCKAEVRGVKCGTCKMQAFQCVICHKGVRGTSNFCLNCGHGGHASHMKEWFMHEIQCPTGCGCQCLNWNPF